MSCAWVFGDDVDTDQLAPGAYMKASLTELSSHCLELLDPSFAREARPGDFVVAGRNFGMGSSREQAVQTLKHLGIAAVIARSFAGIFYRNAFNLGMLALVAPGSDAVRPGDRLTVEGRAGRIVDETIGRTISCEPVPDHLLAMVDAGGLIPHLERRLKAARGG